MSHDKPATPSAVGSAELHSKVRSFQKNHEIPKAGAVTPPGEDKGSAAVVERVAKFSQKPPAVDCFTGKKVCHVFKIPASYLSPSEPKPGQIVPPGATPIELKTEMASLFCMGDKCALWNHVDLECLDTSEKKAQVRIADALEYQAGVAQIHAMTGGDGPV